MLITGGASGIGLAIAQAFSEWGNRVLISGRNSEKLAEAERANPKFHTFQCDITQQDQVRRMFGAIAERHADLNVLVNNAGTAFSSDFLSDDEVLAKAQWEVETNLLGTLRVTKGALPLLLSNGEAAIMTISSAVALFPCPPLRSTVPRKLLSIRSQYRSVTNFGGRASGSLKSCRRQWIQI